MSPSLMLFPVTEHFAKSGRHSSSSISKFESFQAAWSSL